MKSKIKTKKTLNKRLRITKTGKMLKNQVRTGHLKVKWAAKKKYRKAQILEQENKGHKKMFKKMLGKLK